MVAAVGRKSGELHSVRNDGLRMELGFCPRAKWRCPGASLHHKMDIIHATQVYHREDDVEGAHDVGAGFHIPNIQKEDGGWQVVREKMTMG